ncbi:enoyl-CoA hydratase/isomerase family protein [Amycolatopsis acidicola]|uniref:Enoyl-CoA hydratase/isomerase family protein n=1 Tax=Amycolatopsis acidicola TaxID=2596893 RepID=A0A5N0UXM1_9PSEU|nr:enoyl-CoA hydratase/isomerase family protein [Amycolatopsis acidicola]KAA9157800.1 enoyl-CoA hydratase/isomerase family protein [Amycolatopsis acidicola]
MGFETIGLEAEDGIAVLTLNRPRVRNAIDGAMRAELREAVDRIEADTAIRGVVLTGSGTAFCSGGDIRGMRERMEQGAKAGELGWRRQREFHHTLAKLFHLDRPTVAAVNGPAFGLGLDLALTCDFVFAAESAVLAASFVRRGLVPDGGGLFHLPRRVGVVKAKELIFSGRAVDAKEAVHIGLADRVLPETELRGEAVSFLRELAKQPGLAQGLAKDILNRSLELGYDEVNTLGTQAQAICYGSPDHQESVRAFLAAREK